MKTVVFNVDIYSIDNIRKTCEVYKECAKIDVKIRDNQALLRFSGCRFSEELTVKEFENYLIGIENM